MQEGDCLRSLRRGRLQHRLHERGEPVLPDLHGYAVYVNGRWLVSKTTLCGLFRLIDLTQVRACAS